MNQLLRSAGVLALVSAPLFIGACDSNDGNGIGADVEIDGRVTSSSAYGRSDGQSQEGATVTGENVDDEGETTPQEGSATTDENGRYSLDLENATDVVIVTARKGTFESSALVYTEGESSINAAPITAESNAEVQVYMEAKRDDSGNDVTVADVAAAVTGRVADEITDGQASAANVAATIRAYARAEGEYVERKESAARRARLREEKLEAFARFQAALAASSNGGAQEDALEEYEDNLIDAYREAGASAETQAQARIAALTAAAQAMGSMSADASLALRQQASLLAARAIADAIYAAFQARGAAGSRLQQLEQLEAELVADIRAAASAQAMQAAFAEYRTDVEAALAAQMEVNEAAIAAAKQSFQTAQATLLTGLSSASNAGQIASLYATFFTTANANVAGSFPNNTNAELAATVLTLLSIG